MDVAVHSNEHFVTVGGLSARYLEEGGGVPAILVHGTSLGSSADVFRRNLRALGASGVRAIAVDLPGFGRSDAPAAINASSKSFLLRFMDALGLQRAALIGHSSAGTPVLRIALENPERVSHLIVLGTGSLPPSLKTDAGKVGGREGAAQAGWRSAW